MSTRIPLLIAAVLAGGSSVALAWTLRMPLPFDGFAAAVAAGLAFVGTLAVVAWMPRRWVWTEAERLRHAFQARHGVSEQAADSALEAITLAHRRAMALRTSSKVMRDDVAEQIAAVADRLDATAREIFYEPKRHRDLKTVLIRSELIEDAARAHADLRAKNQTSTETASRAKLIAGLQALDAAFDQTELQAARGLLHQVEAASEVAETLLKPRRPLQTHSDLSP